VKQPSENALSAPDASKGAAMKLPPHYENFKCLPECDERHAEDCPREKAEMEYYRWYFAVGTPAFWSFAPLGFERNDDL
jgi:hypothetical protein